MANRRRQNWLGQQRVDVPHLKSIESAVSNDFDELLSGLITGEDKSYVVRGFTISMPGSIGSSANGLQLLVEDSCFLHGASNESGTFFTVPEGTPPEILSSTTNERVDGAFTPSTDNYIGIEFVRDVDDSTIDQVYFWNPTTKVEITKTVPLAILLDYKIVITTSSFASNVLPIAIVTTDSSNNVISITDRRPLLFRVATAGFSNPDPFHTYPWSEGRQENFYTSTSSTSSPFEGGDKQIKDMKSFFDALMSEFKNIKGTTYWYSENEGGSIYRVRQDLANTAFTGKGSIVHGPLIFQGQVAGMSTDVIIKTSAINGIGDISLVADGIKDIDTLISEWNSANPDNMVVLYSGDGSQIPTVDIDLTSTPGRLNWNSDIFLNFIGGRLRYKISVNEVSTDLILNNNQVAYLNLVRGVDIIPNLIFTNGGTVVTSVGNVNWTNDLEPGDFIKNAAEGDEKYYEIDTVDSLFQVTLKEAFQESSSGPNGFDAKYAFGVYETNPAPSNERHVQIADRGSVPFGEDYFWLFFRQDDLGSVPKIYARVLGGQELEVGESQGISDNTSLDIINYIGSTSESDNTPNYQTLATGTKTGTENYNTINSENLTVRISKLTSMVADKAQDKTISIVSNHTIVTNLENGGDSSLQDITFSGGTGTASVVMPSSANNGSVGLGSTLQIAENQVAYISVDRNAAFNLADLSALTVADISAVPLNENVFIFAYRLSGKTVYLWDGTVIEEGEIISLSVLRNYVAQNKTVKLIKGGTWSWSAGLNELKNSASAFIQVAGLADNVNEIEAQTILLSSDGDCAYVTLKRTAGASVLTVEVDNIASVPQDDHTFIIARRTNDEVIIGTSSFALKSEGFLELDGALAEINRYHGQLNVIPQVPATKRVRITGSDILKLNGSKLSLEQKNLLLNFEGAVIDFSTGEIFEPDGITPFLAGINDFTPFAIPAGEYFYYSVSLLPNTVEADNTITGQILVIPAASANASLALAPKAPFPGSGIKLANVYVQEDSGSILNIGYDNIVTLGVGGSGSGGTGDANELLERLKNRLNTYGSFEYLTPVIFSSVEEDETDEVNTTASYSVVNSNYEFGSIGEQFVSVQMLDDEQFLLEETPLEQIELIHFWDINALDELATYEVSRDGGNNWQTVTMDRIGQSDTFRGLHNFTDEPSDSYSQTIGGVVSGVLDFTDLNEFSRQFTLANTTTIKKVTAEITKTASALGYVYAVAVKDDGGVPSTDPADKIGQSQFVSISSLIAGAQDVDFSIAFTQPAGNYHIVFKTDSVYKTEYINSVGANKISISEDGTGIVYDISGLELDLRVRITNGTVDVVSQGFGVLYKNDNKITPVDGSILRHVETFVGDVDNLSEFTISFTPDVRLLNIYELGTGQVYRYGAWIINGDGNIEFPPNTFNKPETINLEFLQIQGGSFDNSDRNQLVLAVNHLGSTNPLLDFSANGRGIFLRRPDGTLREITIDDNDNIVIYSV